MGKLTKSVSYKDAVLDVENMILTESTKEGEKSYSLLKILQEWDGISGVSLSIKINDEIEPDIED